MFLIIGSQHDSDTNTFVPYEYIVTADEELAKKTVQERQENANALYEKHCEKTMLLLTYFKNNPHPEAVPYAHRRMVDYAERVAEHEQKMIKWREDYDAYAASLVGYPTSQSMSEELWSYEPVAECKKISTATDTTIDVHMPSPSAEVSDSAIFADHKGEVYANSHLDVGTKLYDEASMLEFAQKCLDAHLNKS